MKKHLDTLLPTVIRNTVVPQILTGWYAKQVISCFTHRLLVCESHSHTVQMDVWYVSLTILRFHTLAVSHNGHLTYEPNGQPVSAFNLHTGGRHVRYHCILQHHLHTHHSTTTL